MRRAKPQNPLADLVYPRMAELDISRSELVKNLGWANPSKGLRHFDVYSATGHPTSHLLAGLPEMLGLNPAVVETAAAATRQQIADAEEAAARERFRPHILVLTKGGVRVPFFVQAFVYGEKVLALPDGFDEMPSAQQVQQAARIARLHFHENGGELGKAWGTIAGYRLQRTFDHAVVLNTDGTIRDGFDRDREPQPPEIRIKGKRVPVGIFTSG